MIRPSCAKGHAGRLHFKDHLPRPTYGYAIAATLRDSGFADLTEGTLYPLLLRLERKGLIGAEYRAGSGGPSRKYYRLTLTASSIWQKFTAAWQTTGAAVNRIMQNKGGLNHENNAQRIPRLEKRERPDFFLQRWQSTTATPSRKSSAWRTTHAASGTRLS